MNNENNLVLAMLAVGAIADETVLIGKSIDVINEKVDVIKSLGFTSIQSGLGNKPAEAGELPYKSFKTAISGKFKGKTGRLLTEAIRDLRASINYGLESDKVLTDSNPSRAKKDDKKESSSRAAATPKPFDAVKVADNICGKYTTKQVTLLIMELTKQVNVVFKDNGFDV
jgi:hypothetical protein